MSTKRVSAIERNNVHILGKGYRPILFSHGYGCDQTMWRHVYPAFLDDYKVVLFDHTGAGKSDELQYSYDKYNTLEGYAEDLLEICSELNLEDVIIVAHSVSSMIAALAANKNPEIFSALIMVGPSPRYINDANYIGGFEEKDIKELMDTLDSNYLGWAASIAPQIMGNPENPELGEELTNSFCRSNPEIAKHFARVTFLSDNRKDLASINVPTLIIQCSQDIIAPQVVGEYVHNKIPGSTLRILEATGHCPNLSAPEETIEVIQNYLQENIAFN